MIIFLLNLSFSINNYAQPNDIVFSSLTTEDGISLNAVTSVMQDSKGFLWFGTYYGLNRYDGYNFKSFLPDRSIAGSISNHSIGYVYEDSKGYIWMATLDGLNRYDRKTDRFKVYRNIPHDMNSLVSNYVYTILEDSEGTLWIGTLKGLCKYNRTKDNFTVITRVCDDLNDDNFNSVVHIIEDSDGFLWLATWNGVTCMDKKGKILKSYFAQKRGSKDFDYRSITTLLEDNQKNLWIGTDRKGVIILNKYTGKYEIFGHKKNDPYSISHNYVSSVCQDKSGNIWIGTKDGLNKYNPLKKNFTRFIHEQRKPTSIINDNIYSIFEDNTGIIWVGTEGGISRFSQPKNMFHYYEKDNGLSSDRVNAVTVDSKGNVWVGTFDGLDVIDTKGNLIHYKHGAGKNSISHNFVLSVKEDHLGNIWIGTQNDGLDRYNPVTGKFIHYTHSATDLQSISNTGITYIMEDHKGTMWFGTWWGLNKFDRKTEKFSRYTTQNPQGNSILNDLVWNVFEDSEGIIWIGTDGGGLSRLDPKTNKFLHYTRDSSIPYRISENRVFCTYESSDGILWFATSDGLTRYDRKNGKLSIYRTKDGLPGNMICSIIEDDKGFLWLGTDKGLSKLDKNKMVFTNYGKRHGIKELEFTLNVSAKSKQGYIYLGTKYGLMYFHPDSIRSDNMKSPVVFTDFKIYNKSVPIEKGGILEKSIMESKYIKVPSSQEVITFDFALLDFFDSKRNKFWYKLEGFDKNWNDVGTRNNATYTNLPPGEYTFYVRASSNTGANTETKTSLKIYIIPAFYQTWWFRISIAMLSTILVIVFSQIRTRAIKKQNKILENKVAERTKDLDKTIKELSSEISSKDKFFSIIAHDLRSPFTALLGLTQHLNDEVKNITQEEIEIISENLLKSAKVTYNLLENLLQWARIKTGKISFHPQEIDLTKLCEDVLLLYKSNAASKNIRFISEVKKGIIAIADQNMVEVVLRNLVSNAVKFTPSGGNIYINIEELPDSVEIKVTDTGIGMTLEKLNRLFLFEQNVSSLGTHNERGSGLGLILCKEFVEIHKGIIKINSKPGEGSSFAFTLPKQNIWEQSAINSLSPMDGLNLL